MAAKQEFFARVPGEGKVVGDPTGDTVLIIYDRNGTPPLVGEPLRATVVVPLFDAAGNQTGTTREVPVTGSSISHILRRVNSRLANMSSPFMVSSEPIPAIPGRHPDVRSSHHLLRRRPTQ